MNTIWLKIASVVIGILIIIVLVTMFMPSDDDESSIPPEESDSAPITTFEQQKERDKEKYLVTQNPDITPDFMDNTQQEPNIAPSIPVDVQPEPETPKTKIIYVKVLNNLETIEADKEINYAVPSLDIGRLPFTSFKPMVDSARRIINRWPDSVYAYKAKQMLADLPERYQQQYNITPEEMDISMFSRTRAGTVPYEIPIEDR